MLPLLLTALILHKVVISLQFYDCYYLRSICEQDPDCGDGTVFLTKCETYQANKENTGQRNPYRALYIGKGGIKYNEIIRGSQKKQIKNLGNVYSDYQRQTLRDSLYLLKKKLHDQNTQKNNIRKSSKDGKSAHIKKNDDASNANNHISTNHEHISASLHRTPLDTVIHYSVDELNSLGKQHLNKKRHKSNPKYIYNSLKQEVTSPKDITDRALEIEVNKRDVIDKAFDLVQSLINEHERNEISLSLAATKNGKRKVVLGDVSTSTEVPYNKKTSDKSDIKDTGSEKSVVRDIKDIADENYFGEDRLEVATPVYVKNDDIVEETNVKEEEGEKKDNIKDQTSESGNKQDTDSNYIDRGFLVLNAPSPFSHDKAVQVAKELRVLLWNISQHEVFHLQHVNKNKAVYLMKVDPSWFVSNDNVSTVVKRINADKNILAQVNKNTGASILHASSNQSGTHVRVTKRKHWDKLTIFSVIVATSVLVLLCVAVGVGIIKRKGKGLTPLIFRRQEAVQDYQELCRTQMSIVNSPHPDEDPETNGTMKPWNDDQSPFNMDITTGHVILSYMEDHLSNEDRLNKEWEGLCAYKADDCSTLSGSDAKHATKNRYRDVLPYDHTRVKLRETSNAFHSDYINASFITDTNPKNPSYIATQGPLDNTVADFWQMIWEQGVVVIINLTRLSDMGLPQCHHYWPSDGSEIYHIYEVHLISEHIWCDDYLVRSLYLKNLQTAETRTVTQFHYLTWPDLSIPSSPGPLLEFRRKVNKCYRGHACPVIVHCNNGVGRTGTYILLDMVLNRMIKGTKEIDIAATLEHLRDQRQDLVKTKGQFEFALLAVAQEVSTILDAVGK